MTRAGPTARRALPLVVGVAGVVLAHALDYAVVFPHAADRARQLDATGHGYWPIAVAAAFVAGATALAIAVRRGMLGAVGRVADPRPFPQRVAHLAVWQVALFVAVEVAERAAVGVAVAPLVTSPEFLLGLAVQVVVAAVALTLLGAVERAAREIARRRRRLRPTGTPVAAPVPWAFPPMPVCLDTAGPRGPPLALA